MRRELLWLTLTVAMTGLMWIPYILDRMVTRGVSCSQYSSWFKWRQPAGRAGSRRNRKAMRSYGVAPCG